MNSDKPDMSSYVFSVFVFLAVVSNHVHLIGNL